MVAYNTPILNLKAFYNYCLLFFYHFSVLTCVHTMQVLIVFNFSEVKPEVVLAASWHRRVNRKSPIDSLTTVCSSSSFDINRLSLTVDVFCAILHLQIDTVSSFGR
jgi:hypothetical protein